MSILKDKLIRECHERSIELLTDNLTPFGLAAASRSGQAEASRYTRVFARDACLSSLGMVMSGEPKLLAGTKLSLISLARAQAANGALPNSIDPADGQGDFYHLGAIDASLWWLIALESYHRHSGDQDLKLALLPQVKKAFRYLEAQDHNQDGLLEQGEASDWADRLPARGRVLYTNALWFQALKMYGKEREAALAESGLNVLFRPFDAPRADEPFLGRDRYHREKELGLLANSLDATPYYLHYVGFGEAGDRLDTLGNSLALLFGIPSPARAKAIASALLSAKAGRPFPAKALVPPITTKDYDWREYMDRGDILDQPHHYQNGGAWPMIGAFLAMALWRAGRAGEAKLALRKTAEANAVNNWQFNEWFHGRTGEPMGMAGQSWNAGAFILACRYLDNEVEL